MGSTWTLLEEAQKNESVSKKRKAEDQLRENCLKQPKMFEFQKRNKKYEPDSKIQQDFDDAMANFFAGTFSSFNIAQIPEFLKLVEVAANMKLGVNMSDSLSL